MRSIISIAVCLIVTVSVAKSEEIQESDSLYLEEARHIALFYDTLEPVSEARVRQISRELLLIRDTWRDSIPEVDMPFRLAWVREVASVFFDTLILDGADVRQIPMWENLKRELQLKSSFFRAGEKGSGLTAELVIGSIRNPYLIAKKYSSLANVDSVIVVVRASYDRGLNHESQVARIGRGDEAVYYFKTDCLSDVTFTYYRFEVDSTRALLTGSFAMCFEPLLKYQHAWDSLLPLYGISKDTVWSFLMNYEERMWSLRPAWCDTALAECNLVRDAQSFAIKVTRQGISEER